MNRFFQQKKFCCTYIPVIWLCSINELDGNSRYGLTNCNWVFPYQTKRWTRKIIILHAWVAFVKLWDKFEKQILKLFQTSALMNFSSLEFSSKGNSPLGISFVTFNEFSNHPRRNREQTCCGLSFVASVASSMAFNNDPNVGMFMKWPLLTKSYFSGIFCNELNLVVVPQHKPDYSSYTVHILEKSTNYT